MGGVRVTGVFRDVVNDNGEFLARKTPDPGSQRSLRPRRASRRSVGLQTRKAMRKEHCYRRAGPAGAIFPAKGASPKHRSARTSRAVARVDGWFRVLVWQTSLRRGEPAGGGTNEPSAHQPVRSPEVRENGVFSRRSALAVKGGTRVVTNPSHSRPLAASATSPLSPCRTYKKVTRKLFG